MLFNLPEVIAVFKDSASIKNSLTIEDGLAIFLA